jgi:hypothetical protein
MVFPARRRCQIVHGAADQCVAMVLAGVDARVIADGDNGFNRLMVQPLKLPEFDALQHAGAFFLLSATVD